MSDHPETPPVTRQGDHVIAREAPAGVARGRGEPDATHYVQDGYQGVRVSHERKLEGPLAPDEASAAAESPDYDARQPRPPTQDARLIPEAPSAWEATGDGKD